MNYCILNGKKSTLIKGLLIQSLPPISKPLMRTQIEEIDGRDGDIVTKLGYSAYDKEMSIGLFGDYDIDEVISFFDSEGTVIFSNESDKFYKYQIIEQIDFERLVTFKTATVTFHVQPFKYSAVDDDYTFTNKELDLNAISTSKNGVTITVENEIITVTGTASSDTEIYVPINPMKLSAGEYTINALCSGTGASSVILRIIDSVPTDADSLGNTYLALDSGETTLDASLNATKTFKYIWFEIDSGADVNFTLNLNVLNHFSSANVINRGNIYSRPTITIHGTGTIALSINGVELFVINLGNGEYITLDGEEMNAYRGNVLMNRSVIGDYNNLKLKIGANTISWDGTVTDVEVSKITRWI